jgi:hypothetical protein
MVADFSRDTINIRDESRSRDKLNIMGFNNSRTARSVGKSAIVGMPATSATVAAAGTHSWNSDTIRWT